MSREISNSLHVLPFYRHPEHLGTFKKIKIFIGSVGLLPIRVLLSPIGILPPYLLSFLPMTYNSLKYRLFTGSCRWGARFLLYLCGFYKLKVVDKRVVKEPTRLIISNHTSLFDFLVLIAVHDQVPCFICRSSVLSIPFFGRVAQKLGSLYSTGTSGISTSLQKTLTKPGPPIAVFPEATCTNGDFIISFKTGAFVPGIPVLPMTFEYKYKYFSPSFESIDGKLWLFRILSEFSHNCAVTIYPTLYPSEKEKMDPLLYAENVQTFISDQLAIPVYATSRFNQLIYFDYLQNRLTYNEAHSRIYNKDAFNE